MCLQQYLKATSWPFWTSLGLMILVYIVILAAGKARQMWPYDLIMLMSFTIVVGTLLGTLSALYSIPAVLIALGITSGEGPEGKKYYLSSAASQELLAVAVASNRCTECSIGRHRTQMRLLTVVYHRLITPPNTAAGMVTAPSAAATQLPQCGKVYLGEGAVSAGQPNWDYACDL